LLLENLGLDSAEGRVTGTLAVVAEITALLAIGYIGVLADHIGRKPLIVFGSIGWGFLLPASMPL
jgi:MFS family permease